MGYQGHYKGLKQTLASLGFICGKATHLFRGLSANTLYLRGIMKEVCSMSGMQFHMVSL